MLAQVLPLLCYLPQFPFAQDSAATSSRRRLRPLSAPTLYTCHGPDKPTGKLRLDSLAAMKKGGETRPVLIPGKR